MFALFLFLPILAHATLSGDLEKAIQTNELNKAELILRNLPGDQPLSQVRESGDIVYAIYAQLYRTDDFERSFRLVKILKAALERGANPNAVVSPHTDDEFLPLTAIDRIMHEWLHARDIYRPLRTDYVPEARVAEIARKLIDLFFETGTLTRDSTILLATSLSDYRRIGYLEWLLVWQAAPELTDYFWNRGVREGVYDEATDYNVAIVAAIHGDLNLLKRIAEVCDAATTARIFDFRCAKGNLPTPLIGAVNAVAHGVPAERAIEVIKYLAAHGADPARRGLNYDLLELTHYLLKKYPFRTVELQKIEDFLKLETPRLRADVAKCRSALIGAREYNGPQAPAHPL